MNLQHDLRNEVLFDDPPAAAVLFPHYFEEDLMFRLMEEATWNQNSIRMFGKWYAEPRLTCWYGPPYRYAGIQLPARPMSETLRHMADELERLAGFTFNSVLLNLYRTGHDAMGWHRDNEPEMDQRVIASVSFGSPREFRIRRRDRSAGYRVMLGHGDVLLMRDAQEDWEHAVMRTRREVGPRLNCTFRKIRAGDGRQTSPGG